MQRAARTDNRHQGSQNRVSKKTFFSTPFVLAGWTGLRHGNEQQNAKSSKSRGERLAGHEGISGVRKGSKEDHKDAKNAPEMFACPAGFVDLSFALTTSAFSRASCAFRMHRTGTCRARGDFWGSGAAVGGQFLGIFCHPFRLKNWPKQVGIGVLRPCGRAASSQGPGTPNPTTREISIISTIGIIGIIGTARVPGGGDF